MLCIHHILRIPWIYPGTTSSRIHGGAVEGWSLVWLGWMDGCVGWFDTDDIYLVFSCVEVGECNLVDGILLLLLPVLWMWICDEWDQDRVIYFSSNIGLEESAMKMRRDTPAWYLFSFGDWSLVAAEGELKCAQFTSSQNWTSVQSETLIWCSVSWRLSGWFPRLSCKATDHFLCFVCLLATPLGPPNITNLSWLSKNFGAVTTQQKTKNLCIYHTESIIYRIPMRFQYRISLRCYIVGSLPFSKHRHKEPPTHRNY